MPDPLIISKIKLPSGHTYEIQDAGARELIAALEGSTAFLGLTTTALTDGATTNPIMINGVSTPATTGNIVVYDNAEFIWDGAKWIEFGDLSNLGALAYKDTVSLNKGTGDNALGEATTFTNAASAVSFSGGSTDKVLGSDATFTTTVTPTVKYMDVLVSAVGVGGDGTANAITGLGTPSTENFVKSVSAETSNKLVTTTVPNVTSAGSASTWQFAMGTGDDAETLIISGTNSVAPTLGTAKTVATGTVSSSGTGSAVVTDVTIGQSAAAITALGTPTTAACLTGVQVTQQPAARLSVSSTQSTPIGGGDPTSKAFVEGITSASTVTNNKDEVTAVTGLGTATAAAQTITVGTNDKVKVAKFDDLNVSTS